MRITYKDLETKSYSTLIKRGATKEQILNKLSNYYLKESRQLIINEREGKTISKAMKNLKKGRVNQGTFIHKTALTTVKNDIRNLKKLSKSIGKNSFADTLLTEYRRGEINIYQLNSSIYRYTNSISEYESKIPNNKEIELIVDGYTN